MLSLATPLQGWVSPLDEVPDEMFAGRMLGDGVAIDPTGSTLHAPCDAEVVSVARTRHAIVLRSTDGVEILIHIGLETVALNGEGFTAHVTAGDTVKAGDLLIGFDLDFLARRAKSLLTPILITNPGDFAIVWRDQGQTLTVGEPLMKVSRQAVQTSTSAESGDEQRRVIALGLPHGIHARPAARITAIAKAFEADIDLTACGKTANARSPLALIGLGLAHGEEVTVVARGPGAAKAVAALGAFLESDGGEEAAAPPSPPPPKVEVPKPTVLGAGVIRGVCAAPGWVSGPSFLFRRSVLRVDARGQGLAHETASFEEALQTLRLNLAGESEGRSGDIMAAHLALVEDEDLLATIRAAINHGVSAASAWDQALDAQITTVRGLTNARLRERAGDLEDLRRRGLIALGAEVQGVTAPAGAILIADDLLPSEVIALGGRIKGICTAAGGPTSHVAIIAASLNIPAVVAAGDGVLSLADGTPVILDGDAGTLRVNPSAEKLASHAAAKRAMATAHATASASAGAPCIMADGVTIEVAANLGSATDADRAIANGADGCGLLRSEFLFMDRSSPPNEEEQRRAYQAIAEVLAGRPLIIRTLDIGGDKPVAYLPMAREENPALGLRGVRTSLWRPELLHTQLRAILKVTPPGACKIMLPMVASVEEVETVRRVLDEERQALNMSEPVALGVMIETPAAAVTAASLAEVADFFSIGTNDLTQYALAMDRGNPAVAAGVDSLHPAVLRLIAMTCEGAAEQGRWVGVCGALASNPLAAPLLIGLGVTELSATPETIPMLKALIRPMTLERCRELAQRALAKRSAGEVRILLAEAAQ